MADPVEYQLTKQGNLRWQKQVGEAAVVYQASDVRRAPTGVHARIKLAEVTGERVRALAGHSFNLENAKEVIWLAGKAHENLNGTKAAYPKATLAEDLVLFCDGLWEAHVANSRRSGLVMGDEEPSAPRWAVPGLVLYGASSIGFGDSESGKSTLYRVIAQSIQYDVPLLFPTIVQGNVIWVNAEESPQEHSRQFGNVNAALGLSRIEPVYTVDARGLAISDVADLVRDAQEKRDAQHVFVDSLSRLAQGQSLNDNNTATLLMDSLAGTPASVNWIGHTGQENRHRLAGSKHFRNAARVTVRIQGRISNRHVSPELRRGLRVQMVGANGAAPVPAQFFTLEYHRDYGLKSIERSDEEEWPVLHCDASLQSGKACGRRTWDGVVPGKGARCDQHLNEEDEPA